MFNLWQLTSDVLPLQVDVSDEKMFVTSLTPVMYKQQTKLNLSQMTSDALPLQIDVSDGNTSLSHPWPQ